jgi:signal peptidase
MTKSVKTVIFAMLCISLIALLGMAIGGKFFVSIMSNSMEPEIKTGSLIVGSKTPNNLQVGDVIIYKTGAHGKEIFVTHRIVSLNELHGETVYKTQGDNTPSCDPYFVKHSDVAGVYNGTSVPQLGNLVAFLTHPIGLLTLGFLFVLVFCCYAFYLSLNKNLTNLPPLLKPNFVI